MASSRRAFTDEFKAEAVRLVTVEGHPVSQVAKDLGLHESLLRRWKRKLEARQARVAGVRAYPSSGYLFGKAWKINALPVSLRPTGIGSKLKNCLL